MMKPWPLLALIPLVLTIFSCGESYRYVGENLSSADEAENRRIFSLTSDNKGSVFLASEDKSISGKEEAKLVWEKIGEDLKIGIDQYNPIMGGYSGTYKYFKLIAGDGFYNKKTRSKALADFTMKYVDDGIPYIGKEAKFIKKPAKTGFFLY